MYKIINLSEIQCAALTGGGDTWINSIVRGIGFGIGWLGKTIVNTFMEHIGDFNYWATEGWYYQPRS